MSASTEVRLGECVAILAMGQDQAFGQPPGAQLRSCVIAMRIAERMGLSARDAATVYWAALLRYLGCTSHAFEVDVVFGDDIATRSRTVVEDLTDPRQVLREIVLHAGSPADGLGRLRDVLAMLTGGRRYMEMNFRTGCEVADALAQRLGMSEDVRAALRHTFERWRGRGFPNGISGEEISLPMRVVHVSHDMEVIARIRGLDHAVAAAEQRRGNTYDPAVVDALVAIAGRTVGFLEQSDPWDTVLEEEPEPHRMLHGARLDQVLTVAADFADLKSTRMGGHSRAVAELAARAGADLGMADDDICALRRAGWLHDLGRTAIPTAILDKPTGLTRAESDRLELHPIFTQQMLRRSSTLGALNPLIVCHHERLDGSGYPTGLTGTTLGTAARVLATADCYHLLVCADPSSAVAELRGMAGRGGYDPEVVAAVLGAAGHDAAPARPTFPAGLTAREVDVLRLAVRGFTVKQIASELFISPKTADHHIQHIYGKIGVSTRGAAALWAIEHDLVRS